MVNIAELKKEILGKRGICEKCWERPAIELHHCLVHDSKRFHDLVTVPENLMPVCRECHPMCNGYEVRMEFAKRQIKLGFNIAVWYSRLPFKIKDKWILELGDDDETKRII